MNSLSFYIVFDLVLVSIVCLIVYFSYKNGAIYEFVSLFLVVIDAFISGFLAPKIAGKVKLLKPALTSNELINFEGFYFIINVFVWFLILFVVVFLLLLFLKPLLKKLSNIPLFGPVNRTFGVLFGIVKGALFCLLVSFILNFPIVKEYKDIKNNTIIKYVDTFSNTAIHYVVDNIDYSVIEDKISSFELDITKTLFKYWLNNNGSINE